MNNGAPEPGSPRTWRAFAPWSLALLVFAVWGRSLGFEFVWDDRPFILENNALQSVSSWPGIFWRLDAQSSMPEGFVLFRPLRTLHYALLYAFGGWEFRAWLFHLANLVWHAIAVILLFRVLETALAGRDGMRTPTWPAWLGAAAFAVHPVVSEVVCWVKCLDDIMATVFVLAALHTLLKGDRPRLALFYFVLALYSKESAAPFVMVAFLVFVGWSRLTALQSAIRTAPFALAALVFVIHRHLVIGRTSQTTPISGTYSQTLIDTFQTGPEYFRLLFGIPPFVADYSWMTGGHRLFSAPVLTAIVLLVGFSALGIWLWRRGDWVAAFGLAWTGLFLLPVSNLLPMMQYMAERFLYLPLVGWLMALAWLVARAGTVRGNQRWIARGIAPAVVVIGLWGGLAINRAGVWRNDLTLFATTYAGQGYHSPRVEQNAVAAVFERPELRTVFAFERAGGRARLLRKPDAQPAAAALRTLSSAAVLLPRNGEIWAALGILQAVTGQYDAAIPSLEKAARLKPKDAAFWANLGQVYIDARQLDRAGAPLERALQIDPTYKEAWRSRSQLHWLEGDYEQALKSFQMLRSLEPENPDHAYWIEQARERLGVPTEPSPGADVGGTN